MKYLILLLLAGCASAAGPTENVESTSQADCGGNFTSCMSLQYKDISIVYLDQDAAELNEWRFNCTLTPQGPLIQCLAPVWCTMLAEGIGTQNGTLAVCPVTDPVTGMCCPAQTGTATMYAPKYTENRIHDPAKELLGTECTTTSNQAGHMVDKCAVIASTCGFLYCVAP